jgi:hypothetical protein
MSDEGTPTTEQSWPSDPEAPGALEAPEAPDDLAAPEVLAVDPEAPTARTSSDAIVALILSLVSWIACPIIFAIVALVFAMKAEKAIGSSEGNLTGNGLNLAAKLIAWINIGFWIAVLVIGGFIGIVLLLAGAGSQPTYP